MTSLPESLTLRDAQASMEALRQAFLADSTPVWQINAAPLRQLDTSAIAVLLECRRMAKASQRQVQIVDAPARLTDLAALYGVEDLI